MSPKVSLVSARPASICAMAELASAHRSSGEMSLAVPRQNLMLTWSLPLVLKRVSSSLSFRTPKPAPLPSVSWAFPDPWNGRVATVVTKTNRRGRDMVDGGREAVLWDSLAPGFGLRVRPNGRKTWIAHRWCAGAVVIKKLGTLDALRVEDACHAGCALLAGAKAGAVPTMRRFAPSFLADCAERWKRATRATYAHIVRRWILPTFGGRRDDAIGISLQQMLARRASSSS